MYCSFYTEVLLPWKCATSRKHLPSGWGLYDTQPQSYLLLLSRLLHVFGLAFTLCSLAFFFAHQLLYKLFLYFSWAVPTYTNYFRCHFLNNLLFFYNSRSFTALHLTYLCLISGIIVLIILGAVFWPDISSFFYKSKVALFCHFEGWQSNTKAEFFAFSLQPQPSVSPWTVKFRFVSVKMKACWNGIFIFQRDSSVF